MAVRLRDAVLPLSESNQRYDETNPTEMMEDGTSQNISQVTFQEIFHRQRT